MSKSDNSPGGAVAVEANIANFARGLSRAVDAGTASETLEAAVAVLEEFQAALAPTEELGVMVGAPGGVSAILHVTSVSEAGPGVLRVDGTDDKGRRMCVVQHHTQFNLVLVAVAAPAGRSANRIGF